jgi:hypothetical protein
LQRPDPGGPPPDDPTYYPRLLEDEADYNNVAPWPTAADGGGSSLARRGTLLWGDNAASWIAASPSPGVVGDIVWPTVAIAAVMPDPRDTAVDSITITFSEAVSGFGLADLSLTRGGGGNLLTELQTLGGGGTAWTLGNLAGLTGLSGTYVLALTAAGSGIIDAANNPLSENAVENWVMNSTVAGRHIFYNRSAFDGGNAAANAADDAAIADKQALLPGGTAAFANYTSYTRGINGIMVDLAGVADPQEIDAADFTFKVGNEENLGNWTTVLPTPNVSVRIGDGAGGSDRATIIWDDNAIQNRWLQVTVLAAGTGLAADDVFYFGNAIGETGFDGDPDPDPNTATVNAQDELAVRSHKTGFAPTSIANVYDFNRDRRVSASDELTARYLATTPDNALKLIHPAAGGGAVLLAMADPGATLGGTGILPVQSELYAAAVPAVPLPLSGATASGATGVSPVPSASAHDAALTSASWLWAYEWEHIGPRKSSAKKDPAAVSAVDRVLATEWV